MTQGLGGWVEPTKMNQSASLQKGWRATINAMVLLIAALAAASPPPAKAEQQARASVTILRGHRASAAGWAPASRPNQREIVKKEKDGSEVRLRLTEFE